MLTMETATYLGPARVTEVEDRRVRVGFPDEETAWARLALAIPYHPVVGDELLVVRLDGEQLYAIGVLEGRGETTLRVPGNLNLEAPNGAINLTAPHVHVRAGKFELSAQRIIEKAHDVYRWISGLFQVKSARMRTVVETDYHLKAGTIHEKATGDVNIDGESINLG